MILLVRHAHAVDKDDADIEDESRWLTAKGREVARRAGEKLRQHKLVPDEIWTSPLVRAVQTAELVAQGARYGGSIEVVQSLAPGGGIRRAAEALEGRGGVVAAVGHEPGISALAAHLVGKAFPAFKKGQIVVIEDGKATHSLDPDKT